MNKNIITFKSALSTGLFLGGVVMSTPTIGAEIDNYVSPLSLSPLDVSQIDDSLAMPIVSFDCNAETEISIKKRDDMEILSAFANSILNGMKSLDADISQWVDDNFWDLV